ncbi:unnamed protein product [Rotaria socialis]|uniref:NHL repeat-containing protein n=1 Tax=Rotaria socialis TaxID=392032 RepID=A0A820MNA5_9BILA|nr:unnamed protein product [Rotaria socialis]
MNNTTHYNSFLISYYKAEKYHNVDNRLNISRLAGRTTPFHSQLSDQRLASYKKRSTWSSQANSNISNVNPEFVPQVDMASETSTVRGGRLNINTQNKSISENKAESFRKNAVSFWSSSCKACLIGCLIATLLGSIVTALILTMWLTSMSDDINTLTIPTCATWNQAGITVAGNQNTTAGSDLAPLNYPIDIFVDDNYTLYISDADNSRIVMYYENAASGILVAGTSVGNGSTQLSKPKGVAVDTTGAVFVATTVTANSISSPLGTTRDLHIDCNDDIYVTDSDHHQVTMFYSNSSIGTVIAGTGVAGSASSIVSVVKSIRKFHE